MTETPLSATLGLLAFGVLVLLIAAVIANVRWPHKHPARQDGNQPPARRGTTRVPYHCATFGHYYRKAFADRWQCAECGHVVTVEFAAGLAALAKGGIDREPDRGEAS